MPSSCGNMWRACMARCDTAFLPKHIRSWAVTTLLKSKNCMSTALNSRQMLLVHAHSLAPSQGFWNKEDGMQQLLCQPESYNPGRICIWKHLGIHSHCLQYCSRLAAEPVPGPGDVLLLDRLVLQWAAGGGCVLAPCSCTAARHGYPRLRHPET